MLEASLKDKLGNYFSEEDIFQPPENKSLRVRSAAFEMQLNHLGLAIHMSPYCMH